MIGPLTNHLWQSTLFAATAGLLTLAFRRNRAQVRYWLWLSASLKFLVPFSLLIGLGNQFHWAPEANYMPTSVPLTLVEISEPFPIALPATSASTTTNWLLLAIIGVWACGFAAIVAMRLRHWLRIHAAVRASTLLETSAPVRIRTCPGRLEPGVVGFFRPILLLPADIRQHLTPAQFEAVLVHELCHIRRRDNLTAAIHMIVEAIFWFHPLSGGSARAS
jgi:beta-lactamase regulating signal transducer with metallopeptidase domain